MDVYKYLPQALAFYIDNYRLKEHITEIRLRRNKAVQLTVLGKCDTACGIVLRDNELEDIFYKMCGGSRNIYDDEISNGYITLSDGCRVGIGGEFYYNASLQKYILKELMSLNIRISRDNVFFENQSILFEKTVPATLVAGPPHSGKTSLLKLYAQQLSENFRVVLCDERNELYTENINCDVLKGIKKPLAVSMATRTLNPQYIICDEIGLREEAEEILSAVNTGVKFICSAHGKTKADLMRRPNVRLLLDSGVFEKIVFVAQQQNRFFIKDCTDV
ncbi:MAG: hypothetical protein IJO54_01835 [Oscillospiraceae bacterium]|nr:hypothetical protein [Oscillospiraceae bacterium]